MRIENIEVLIEANADQFRRELADVNKKLESMGSTTQSSAGIGVASMGKLGIAIAVAGKAVEVATKSVKKMAGALKGVVSSAITAVESESLVATVFRDGTQDIQNWSNELSRALGINAYESRRTAGVFYNIADAMGLSNENALTLSKGIVSLGNDMASFYNLNIDEAFTKLRAGIVGETEPLKQLGIIVTENQIKQTALKYGIIETSREMSNQEKVLARYMTILDQTTNAQGDLARTMGSPANQIRILKSRIQEITITLGSIFLPILAQVLPYIQAFVVLIGEAVQRLANFFGIVGIDVSGYADALREGFNSVVDGANTAGSSVDKLKSKLAGLAGFDEMNVLNFDKDTGGGGGASGVGGGGFSDFKLPEYDLGIDGIKNKVLELVNTLKEKFAPIGDFFKRVFEPFSTYWRENIKPALSGLKVLWGELVESFKNSPLGEILTTIAELLITVVGGAFIGLFEIGLYFLAGITAGLTIMMNNWTRSWNNAIDVIANVILFFRNFKENIQSIWNNLVEGIKTGLGAIKSIFAITWDIIVSRVTDKIQNIKDRFSNLKNSILDVFNNIKALVSGIVSSLVDSIRTRLDTMKTSFINLGTAIVTAVKKPINDIIWRINSFLETIRGIKIPVIAPNGIQVPNMRYLATGGVVNSPTMAVMGEGGYAEAVLPLERNTGWAEQVADLINRNGGNREPINLVVQIGEDKIYENVVDFINDGTYRRGTKLLNI